MAHDVKIYFGKESQRKLKTCFDPSWVLGWEEGFQQRGPAVIPPRWLDFVVSSIVVEVNEEEGSEQGGFGGRLKGGREGQTELVF